MTSTNLKSASDRIQPSPAAPRPLRDARKEFTRERICAAAREIFFANSYANSTMEQIAEAAGTRRSTVYNHFRDKDDILDAIGREYGGALMHVLARVPSPHPDYQALAQWVEHDLAPFIITERVPTILLSQNNMSGIAPPLSRDIGAAVLTKLAERLPAFALTEHPTSENGVTRAHAILVIRNLSWCCLQYAEQSADADTKSLPRDWLIAATDTLHAFVTHASAPPAQT